MKKFEDVFREELTKLIKENPENFDYSIGDQKFEYTVDAAKSLKIKLDGLAVNNTCKTLNIECTYEAIKQYQIDSKCEFYCLNCNKGLVGFVPQICCSGYLCDCRGVPTNPPFCSNDCWAKYERNQKN